MKKIRKAHIIQFTKYAAVGVLNTLVTLIVIFLCKSIIGINEYISNALGYIAGLINSFIWNKNWVFKAKDDSIKQIYRFAAGFLICYGLQFLIVWSITEHTSYGTMQWEIGPMTFSGYGIATIVGMGVYTIANFIYNRQVTFR
ncbi:MAG: GtrA family protein [Bacteroides sp.]|nr:GtrA family protein [Bacteroides sp.]